MAENKTDGSFVHSLSEISKFITLKVPSNGQQSVNIKDKVISIIPKFTVGHVSSVKSKYPVMNNVSRQQKQTVDFISDFHSFHWSTLSNGFNSPDGIPD